MLVSVFISGLVIGCAICLSVFACCKHNGCNQTCIVHCDTTGINKIEVGQANGYFNNYMDSAVASAVPFKAFAINLDQFTAMKLLARDSTVHGFRIYMGLDEKGNPVRLVVGTGSPDKTGRIYATAGANSGPCPDFCDEESKIMGK
jgi:hypothetical protein